MNWTLRSKLVITYIFAFLLAATAFAVVISYVSQAKTTSKILIEGRFLALDLVLEVRAAIFAESAALSDYLTRPSQKNLDKYNKLNQKTEELLSQLLSVSKKLGDDSLVRDVINHHRQVDRLQRKNLSLLSQKQISVRQFSSRLSSNVSHLDEHIEKLELEIEEKAEKASAKEIYLLNRVSLVTWITSGLFILIAFAGSLFIFRTFSEVADKLSNGSAQIFSSTSKIAESTIEMSKGAESQLSQIVDTSSAMEEMSSSIKEVSESAKGASESAATVSNQVRENTAKIKETIAGVNSASEAINKLKSRSEEIGKVIKLISEIASQTNILALNAAIEAARAGEYGKGFDVVAEEIRQLAQRTAQSTAEIAPIIEKIQKETQATAEAIRKKAVIAAEVGTNFDAMAEGIMSATSMSKSISVAAAQQAKTATQIANSLQIISGVSRKTSKNAEETVSATRDLTKLAEKLKEIISQLKAA